jgi:flagellar biosynthesis protein FlhG
MGQGAPLEGQTLVFTTDSVLHKDIYRAPIVGAHEDHLELNIPLHKGYLLMIPIGTNLRILNPETGAVFTAQVLSRQTAEKTWTITVPRPENHIRSNTVIAIGSGKGGVGKTTLGINLGLAMCKLGKRVLIMDADIGMANVEVLLRLKTPRNLTHVLNGECSMRDIVTEAPGGLKIIPGSSGISTLTSLDAIQFNRIINGFAELESYFDIVVVDTGAGISEIVLKLLEAADQLILITTPEPHAMMDTYAVAKALALRNEGLSPFMVFNRCEAEEEALHCLSMFERASARFLQTKPQMLGWISEDKRVPRSLKEQVPLLLSQPEGTYAEQITAIAQRMLGMAVEPSRTGLVSFFSRLKRSFSR